MKFKSYNSCIKYLFSLERVGIKYDLNNIRKLVALSDNPHKNFKSIHIAGTNGKGSVASMISSVLTESGFKTGLYTSPHVKDFRERIRINGKMIPKDYVISFTEKLYKEIEKIIPSFFEVTTAMAFKYFSDNDVEYAVIECGLGGRLDSTNILRPLVSVITSIAIDHTEFLGDTIEKITYEKAGIIKKGIPCVTGTLPENSQKQIYKICESRKSKFIRSDKNARIKTIEFYPSPVFDVKSKLFNLKGVSLPLTGNFQMRNLKTVFSVFDVLKEYSLPDLNEIYIRKGLNGILKNTGFDYRFKELRKNPLVIADVSHNTEGIKNIGGTLKNFKYRKLFVVFGMMSDKEFKKCINELEKLKGFMILTKPDYKRSADPSELLEAVKNKNNAVIRRNVKDAYAYAVSKSGKNDLILVTGSFFLLSDFLKIFKNKND
ncbi:MAG: bifunctional folylpolyglutamate synthase/dihydrofolate synthase [Ignavibacteria bacterium]|nr:bifunctional folylpolyglutamate synthase/dihydrofolate synthase [Ignavibacteria bacterium]